MFALTSFGYEKYIAAKIKQKLVPSQKCNLFKKLNIHFEVKVKILNE